MKMKSLPSSFRSAAEPKASNRALEASFIGEKSEELVRGVLHRLGDLAIGLGVLTDMGGVSLPVFLTEGFMSVEAVNDKGAKTNRGERAPSSDCIVCNGGAEGDRRGGDGSYQPDIEHGHGVQRRKISMSSIGVIFLSEGGYCRRRQISGCDSGTSTSR